MADTTALKNRIRAAIKANDNQEITGPVLQQALLDMVDELNGATETEAFQRQNGDSTLQRGINTERQQRQEADTILQQNIDTESQRAQGVEQNLQQSINTEAELIQSIKQNLNISLGIQPISYNSGYLNPTDAKIYTASVYTTLIYEVKANDVLTFGGKNSGRINFVSTYNTSNVSDFDLNTLLDVFSTNDVAVEFTVNQKTITINQNCYLAICINNSYLNKIFVSIGDCSLYNIIKTQEQGFLLGSRYNGALLPSKILKNRIINPDGSLSTVVFNGYTVLVYEVKQGDNLYFKGSITGGVTVVGLYSSCEDINSATLIEKIRYQNNITVNYDFDYTVPQDGYLVFTVNSSRDYTLEICTSDTKSLYQKDIQQQKGQSTTKVMSQKAVSDELNNLTNLKISLGVQPISYNSGYLNPTDAKIYTASVYTTFVYEVKAGDVVTFSGKNLGIINFVSTYNTSNVSDFDLSTLLDVFSTNDVAVEFTVNQKTITINQNCYLAICINNSYLNKIFVSIGDCSLYNTLYNIIKTQEQGFLLGSRYNGALLPSKILKNRIINPDGSLSTVVFNGYTVLVYEVKQGDNLYFKGTVNGGLQVLGLYSSSEDINSTTRIEVIAIHETNKTVSYDLNYTATQNGYLVFTVNSSRDYILSIANNTVANNLNSNGSTIPLSAKMGKTLYNNSKYLLDYIHKEAFKTEVLTPSSEISGKGISPDGGEFTMSVYTIRKYSVTEGTIIGIKGYMRGGPNTGVYAFYSGNNISSNDVIAVRLVSNTSGSPKTYYDEICMVPSGATMLAVCIDTEYPSTDDCLAYYVEPLTGENVMAEKILGNPVLWYRKAYLASDGDNTMHPANNYRTYCLSVQSGQKLKLKGSIIGNVIVAGVFSSMVPSISTLIELIETCTNSASKYYTDYEYTIQNSGYLFICENKADNRNLYFSVDDNVKVLSELPLLTNIRSQNTNWNCDNIRKIFLAQDKDLYVTLNGDSVTAWQSAKSKADAGVTNVPPVCDKKAVAYWLYETLKFGNAIYKRFDAGKFSLVGDWDDTLVDDSTAVFTETGTFKTLYDHDRIRTNNPAITTLQTEGATFPEKFTNYETQRNIPMRFSNSANASVTFTVPAGNMKADFIYHAHKLGDNITITINRGNGVVVVNDKPNDWENAIEANGCIKSLGYDASAVQAITGSAANDGFGVSNKKLHFKILNTENDTTITITKTSDTNKYIIYWGISYWGTENKPYAFHLNDQGIGGLSTLNLLWLYSSNVLWSYCDLQIFQIPTTHYTFTENYDTIKTQLDNVIDIADAFGIDTVFEFPTSDVSDATDSVWNNRTDYLKYMKWCILNKNKEIIGDARDLSKKVWENSYKDRITFYNFLRSLFVDVVHVDDNGGLFYRALFENVLN